MKSNRLTLTLCLVVSAKKYFKVLMEVDGDQLYPTNSFLCRSPLTKILNFYLSILTPDLVLTCTHPCIELQVHLSLDIQLEKSDC